MSAPGGAPSPSPRSASIGPNTTIAMPTQQTMNSNSSVAGGPSGPGGSSGGGMSQQNLNQIVSHLYY